MIQKEKLFQEIIEDNQEKIFRICCYYSKDAEERKDLFQEMLINIWSSLKSFKGESALGTWIYCGIYWFSFNFLIFISFPLS